MAARKYMEMYGEDRTRQALAEIAVSTRKWANKNEKPTFTINQCLLMITMT